MAPLVAPIHVEALGSSTLRFFAPPSGEREFPWIAIDDLHACLGLPRALRREFKTKLRSSEWKDDTRTVATADGIVNIAPHFMAQGLIHAMQDVHRVAPDFYDRRYAKAGARAMDRLVDGLQPRDLLNYIEAAVKASGRRPTPSASP